MKKRINTLEIETVNNEIFFTDLELGHTSKVGSWVGKNYTLNHYGWDFTDATEEILTEMILIENHEEKKRHIKELDGLKNSESKKDSTEEETLDYLINYLEAKKVKVEIEMNDILRKLKRAKIKSEIIKLEKIMESV